MEYALGASGAVSVSGSAIPVPDIAGLSLGASGDVVLETTLRIAKGPKIRVRTSVKGFTGFAYWSDGDEVLGVEVSAAAAIAHLFGADYPGNNWFREMRDEF